MAKLYRVKKEAWEREGLVEWDEHMAQTIIHKSTHPDGHTIVMLSWPPQMWNEEDLEKVSSSKKNVALNNKSTTRW